MSLNRITLFVAILGMICFSSCDGDDPNSGGIDTKDSKELVLKVIVPGINNSVTRGINAKDENELGKIDVLVFKVNGANEEFLYHTSATDEHISNSSKTFKVLLQKSIGGARHRIVVLANLRAEINAVKDSFTVGDPKADVLKSIEFSSTTAWDATNSSSFRLLPMWGESYDTHVITSSTSGGSIGNIYLVRSLAKIDVLLADNGAGVPQGLSGFKLSSVKLFKSREKGHAVPSGIVRTTDAGTGNVNIKVTTPTIPLINNGYNPKLNYDTPTIAGGFLGEIYVLENNNKTERDENKRTCIVVGGYYTSSEDLGIGIENTTDVTWYRIDFYDRNGALSDRLDILRNHRYRVNITSVGGPGYKTPEIAFESTPVNLESEVIAWDEGEMNNHTSDGQYDLTTDKNEITLYEEGNHPQQLSVFTNHPGGWSVEIPTVAPEDYSWISVSPDKLISSISTKTNVYATPYLNQLTERKGYFWLKAGRMKKKIYVTQLNVPELMLEITPSELVFRKSGSNPKSVTVTSYPTGAVRFMSSTGDVVWASGSDPATDLSGLTMTSYTFQPAPNLSNPAKTLNSFVTIWINHPNGTKIARILTVRQLATDLLFSVTLSNYYSSAATYSFTVDSDTPWRISSVVDPSSALAGAFDNTIKGIGTGTVYSFPLTANYSWQKRSITFIPSSDDPDFSGQPFTIEQNNPAPSLTLDKGSINFGGVVNPGNNSVFVTSNAKWQYSVSGDWNNAVASSTPVAGAVQGAHNYHTTSSATVTITPKVWAAAAGTPTAGTVYTGTSTFSTADHSPATAATKNLTVSRTVPAFFAFASASNVGRVGGNTTATANTNAAWKVTSSVNGAVSAVHAPSIYAAGKAVTVSIPENTTWSVPAATAPVYRNIDITATYGVNTSSVTTGGGTLQITQPGYYISNSATSWSIFTRTSGTIYVGVTGAYPALTMRAASMTDGSAASTGTAIIAAGEWGERSNAVTITANDSWSARGVIGQFYDPRYPAYMNAGTSYGVQPGWDLANVGTGNLGGLVPSVGSNDYYVYMQTVGGCPDFSMLVSSVYATNGWPGGWHANNPGPRGGANGNRYFTIPANPDATVRNLYFYYEKAGLHWEYIGTIQQQEANIKLSSGRMVARNTIEGTWATLMGIDPIYNNTKYPHSNVADYTYTYAVANGGCAAYSELGYPQGTWRMPTSSELIEMKNWGLLDTVYGHAWYNSKDISASQPDGWVWNGSRYEYLNETVWGGVRKSHAHGGRCVRWP